MQVDVWIRRFREGDELWAMCSNPTEGQEKRSKCSLPDGGGPDQTAEELRTARPQDSSPSPPFFRMTAPETLGDFMKTESGPNWERRIHGAGAGLFRTSGLA